MSSTENDKKLHFSSTLMEIVIFWDNSCLCKLQGLEILGHFYIPQIGDSLSARYEY